MFSLVLALPLAAQAGKCKLSTLEQWDPGGGEVLSRKTLTGAETQLEMDYPCQSEESDEACLRRVGVEVSELGTDIDLQLSGLVDVYRATFVIGGERFEGDFESKKEVLARLEREQKKDATAVLENVIPVLDASKRLVKIDLTDATVNPASEGPRVRIVWDPENDNMFDALSHLESTSASAGVDILPGKWRSDGHYEFVATCP